MLVREEKQQAFLILSVIREKKVEFLREEITCCLNECRSNEDLTENKKQTGEKKGKVTPRAEKRGIQRAALEKKQNP